jgi:hypothetical protein
MPDKPVVTNTQDLANAEYDAERWARVHDHHRTDHKRQSESAADGVKQSDRLAENLPGDKPQDR